MIIKAYFKVESLNALLEGKSAEACSSPNSPQLIEALIDMHEYSVSAGADIPNGRINYTFFPRRAVVSGPKEVQQQVSQTAKSVTPPVDNKFVAEGAEQFGKK